VDGILTGAERMHEIVNTMLDVSKIDNQVLDLQKRRTTLSLLLERVQNNLEEALAERKQTLMLRNLNELPSIQADGDLLYKVFYNIIINAIKYTPDEGLIVISGEQVSPNLVEITINDTGIGIDPNQLELIFEKFYQTGEVGLHSTGKTKFKGGGPGLGLAIAKGIILAHDGKVWAESEKYDEDTFPGSKFVVQLPVG